jgi:hypothetical protein
MGLTNGQTPDLFPLKNVVGGKRSPLNEKKLEQLSPHLMAR